MSDKHEEPQDQDVELSIDDDGNLFEGETHVGTVEDDKILNLDGEQIGEISEDGEALFYAEEDADPAENSLDEKSADSKKGRTGFFNSLAKRTGKLGDTFSKYVGTPAKMTRNGLSRAYDIAMMPVRDNYIYPSNRPSNRLSHGKKGKAVREEVTKNVGGGAAASTVLVGLLPMIDIASTGGVVTIITAALYGRPILERAAAQTNTTKRERENLPDHKRFFPSVKK